jgi:16S rRNA G966 N2-methylase RsmD
LSEPSLKNVADAGLLAPAGIVVIQTHKTELFAIPSAFEVFRTERYGDTLVRFLRAAKQEKTTHAK